MKKCTASPAIMPTTSKNRSHQHQWPYDCLSNHSLVTDAANAAYTPPYSIPPAATKAKHTPACLKLFLSICSVFILLYFFKIYIFV